MASLDFLKALENALLAGCGFGFEAFDNAQLLHGPALGLGAQEEAEELAQEELQEGAQQCSSGGSSSSSSDSDSSSSSSSSSIGRPKVSRQGREEGSTAGTSSHEGPPDMLHLGAPASLSLCMDEEGKQWSAINFLKWKLHLCIQALRDPHHRSWNDMANAIREGGGWPAFCHSLVIYNISYGPWQNAAFFPGVARGCCRLAAAPYCR